VEARVAEVVLQRGRETLLVVDDELMIVEMLKMLFSELGYRVFATTNPLGAMDIFSERNEEIDLVITDQTMPKLTGETLAGRMLEISPEIPIILCTGYSEKMSEAHCRQLGIAKLVSKPVDTAYLSQVVRQLLDKKGLTPNRN
jgi:CheY-like chemotaxis protein